MFATKIDRSKHFTDRLGENLEVRSLRVGSVAEFGFLYDDRTNELGW